MVGGWGAKLGPGLGSEGREGGLQLSRGDLSALGIAPSVPQFGS